MIFFEFTWAIADFQQEQGSIDGWEKDWQQFAQFWNSETLHFRLDWQLPVDWACLKVLAYQKNTTLLSEKNPTCANTPTARAIKSCHIYGQFELFCEES